MTYVRVMLEYLHPWTNSAGFFIAADQGGIRRPASMSSCPSRIHIGGIHSNTYYARNRRSPFSQTNRLLVRRDHHQPLLGIASINHRAMETLQTAVATGIRRPRDLEGRRVAYNPTPRGIAMVRHLVTVDGGDPDLVITVDSGTRETANGRHPRR